MRRNYNDDTKAAAMAALLSGQSISAVAKAYDIPDGTVKGWASKRKEVAIVPTEKKEEIGELLLSYLRANLAALDAQARVFANAEWLEKQSASEAAVLHGVMTDKAIRLIEAMRNVADA